MQVPETDIYWTYSLVKTSETKASARTGVPAGASHELVGIDGSNDGGLQPFPGFREVHRFTPASGTFSGTNPYTGLSHKSSVRDCWGFSVIAGTSTRVWGYVYVAKRPNNGSWSNTYDLLMDYYAPQSGTPTWSTAVLKEAINGGPLSDATSKSVMSIETTGRMIYVFDRGSAPVAVYFKYSGGNTTVSVNQNAGPGIRPKSSVYQTSPPWGTGAGSTHVTGDFPDPTAVSGGAYTNPPGSVVFALTSATPGSSSPNGATIANFTTATTLQAGTYGMAVQFEDSRSGRKSQLSKNEQLTFTGSGHPLFIDGVYDASRYDTLNIYRSVRGEGASGTFTTGILQLEAQITLSSYTVAYTGIPVASGTLPNGGDITYFRYAYQLNDTSLVMQDVFVDKPSYYETMPKGGAGILYDGTMLVGNISDSAGDQTGTGETRWSSGGMDSPELFMASSNYKPESVGDAVLAFRRTGQVVTGFTKNGVQFFSKQTGFVAALAAHNGYGIVGPYAAATVGPVTYYLNARGLKAVYTDGRLDDVQAIDNLIQGTWYSETLGTQDLLKVSMAFDPATLVLYILNPVRQEAVQFWFSTGTVSELRDMAFDKCFAGWWQDTDGTLHPRASFLMNSPYPDAVTDANFRPAVYVPSRNYSDKANPEPNIDHEIYMIDGPGTHNPTSPVTFASSNYTYYNSTGVSTAGTGQKFNNVLDTTSSTRNQLIGAHVYVVDSATTTDIGNNARIRDVDANYVYLDQAISTSSTASVVLSPIYTRWVGGCLRVQGAKEEEFMVKQPSSMGCVFTDVDWTEAYQPTYRRWRGLMYRENESTPMLSVYPTNSDGTTVAKSVIRGDSPVFAAFGKHGFLNQWLFAGIETFLANVRFRLVGVQVKGRMLPTDRTRRTY